jgi:hypothetical protein
MRSFCGWIVAFSKLGFVILSRMKLISLPASFVGSGDDARASIRLCSSKLPSPSRASLLTHKARGKEKKREGKD